MKWLMSVFAGALLVMMITFMSCTNNTPPQNEMQQPVPPAEQQANPDQAGNAAGEAEDDDDNDENKGGQKNGTTTVNAKATNFQNLQDAFKGETTASAKYAAYSKKAEEEGQHAIAMLFKAASASENSCQQPQSCFGRCRTNRTGDYTPVYCRHYPRKSQRCNPGRNV